MAISWGPWTGKSSTHRVRVGVEYVSLPAPTASQSAVPVKANLWAQCRYYFHEGVTIAWSGSLGSGTVSKTISFPASNSTVLLQSLSASVPVSYGAATKVTVAVSVSNVNYIGGSYKPSHTASAYVAARPYQRPAKVNYVSAMPEGSKWRFNFPSVSTAAAPAQHRILEIYTEATKRYVRIANTTGQTWLTGYLGNNNRAIARALAYNTSGHNGWTYGVWFTTRPSDPTNVTAAKSGVGQILVSWTDNAPHASSYRVRHYEDGQDKGVIGVVPGSATSYQATGLDPSKVHRFGVSAEATEGYTFESGVVLSNPVQLDAPPHPPTGLAPNGYAKDAQQTIPLRWRYNSADSSAQTAYELRYRLQGTPSWTVVSGTGAASSYDLPADTWANGNAYEWQVRTKAQHPDWGGWSATAVAFTSTPPVASIISPADGGTVGSDRVTVEWGYFDEEGEPQSRAGIHLYKDGNVVSSVQLQGAALRKADIPLLLVNNATYVVVLKVYDARGAESQPAEASFTTDFAPPPAPEVVLSWVEDRAAVELIITNPGGTPDPLYNVIERSLDGGSTWDKLGEVPLDASYYDPFPSTYGETKYRVSSVSGLPSLSDPVEVSHTGGDTSAWLTFGVDNATAVCVPYNLAVPGSYSPASTTHSLLGRENPVALYNLDAPAIRKVSLSGVHLDGCMDESEALEMLSGNVYYRDPAGRRFWGCVDKLELDPHAWGTEVSLSLIEVEG